MKVLHDALQQIEALGARLVGMAPEIRDKSMVTAERHRLQIDILNDADNLVSESLGLGL